MPLLKGPQALINFALIIVLPKKNARGRRAAPVRVGELLPGVGRQDERLGDLGAVLEVSQGSVVRDAPRLHAAPLRPTVPRRGRRERVNEADDSRLLGAAENNLGLPVLCHDFLSPWVSCCWKCSVWFHYSIYLTICQ